MAAPEAVFLVTDIETGGPWPGPNSMRSFGTVGRAGTDVAEITLP